MSKLLTMFDDLLRNDFYRQHNMLTSRIMKQKWPLLIHDSIMDAKLYAESVEYELLTQAVYQAVLSEEGDKTIAVEHNVNVKGRSGVEHQVDVRWRFKKAGIEYTTLVECKNYGSAISLEKVRNFFAVLHDIGNCQGLMVTKTGYQSGVEKFAEHYGIGLKLLRKPTEEDWEGRVKDIKGQIQVVGLDTSLKKAPRVSIAIAPDVDQAIKDDISGGRLTASAGPDLIFIDNNGLPLTEEMRWWLPKTLAKEKKPVGGPYQMTLPLESHYIELRAANGATHRVKVAGITVEYHYVVTDTREFIIAGAEVVKAILKDNSTSEVEHVHRR